MSITVSAILLAAGESKRMGKPKLLMPLGKTTILEQTIDNLLGSRVSEVIVVLGYRAEEAINILPQAEVVAISGTSLINHTLENLLNLCHNSFVVIVGPSCPLSPVLFNYGVDVLAGAKVVKAEAVIEGISQGATLRQVKGIKLLAMRR